MSDVDARAVAEAEMAKAQADLAAAEAEEKAAEAAEAASRTVRLYDPRPWHAFDPGDGLPVITDQGSDVPETVAERILAAAAAQGVTLRKD